MASSAVATFRRPSGSSRGNGVTMKRSPTKNRIDLLNQTDSEFSPVRKRTFRRKRLEADFIHFCQMHSKASADGISRADFEVLKQESDAFILSIDFVSPRADSEILGDSMLDLSEPAQPARAMKMPNLPPHLAGLCEAKLLAPEQERKLFQRMNYLRYRASKLLEDKTPENVSQWDVERVNGLLRAAEWHRDRIVQSNLRLVISIVKKFVNTQCSFDDLLSDGIMALIRSVDKFDYQLGFRFSTYATQVVRRNSYRFVMDRQDERLKVTNSISDGGVDIAEEPGHSPLDEARFAELRGRLASYLDQLDKREKFIIRARFSLGGHRKVQTLQKLAERLGISKERVRQLEKRAMEKLTEMASKGLPLVVTSP